MHAYQLRPAVQADASTIFRLCTRLHQEAGAGLPPIDATKAMHTIVHAIGEGLVVVLGAEKAGRRIIVGVFGAMANADWFTAQGSLRDLSLYVLPEYRSFRAARMLVQAGSEMAARHEMKLRLGVFGGKDIERKIKLYERLGFRPIGVMFVGE